MAAYYTRVLESGWTFLPAESFPATLTNPTTLATCGASPGVLASPACRAFYDPEFTTAGRTQLRGAYGSLAHVEQGPRGLAEELTKAPEFASCVVSKIGASLLRRDLTLEDEAWRDAMKDVLVAHGFKTKALVKAILRSDRYRASNDVRMSKASSDGGKP
jgi:hypothetical protein